MDPSRLRAGELISGSAALALLGSLFLDWNRDTGPFDASASIRQFGTESGWSSLGWLMLLLLLGAVALALLLVVTTARRSPVGLPVSIAVVTAGVGIVVTLVLAVRLLFLDDSLGGAYLGGLLMLLISVGGWVAMADERTEAPSSAAPDLPRRPAPPAEA